MGVFSWFRRKSKDDAEVSTEGGREATPSADATTESVTPKETETEETTEATEATNAAEAADTTDTTDASASGTASCDEVSAETANAEAGAPESPAEDAEAAATEGLEIPKQQSAAQAADNEIGESVRK